jgi:hypothetical protein
MNKNTNKKQLQQGDVILRRVTSIPADCKQIKDPRGAVLAEGEHTGHYHGASHGLELFEAPDKRRYVINVTNYPIEVRHQEHKPIKINPGETFLFGQVMEKDWFSEMVRPVID